LFLIGWEIMSIASFFLVIFDRRDPENVKAGYLYLVMTYVGTAFILFALLLLYKYTGSFDFDVIRNGIASLPAAAKNTIFIAALIGFGIKAGIIPLHIWLPAAHPAAPSHISALMSGVMIKTGIFMMVRLFIDILQPAPVWWGIVVLAIGIVSSLLGVLYALTEHDIKRLLAYHSIENIGIIMLGLGSSLIFSSLGMPALALVSLTAALFHTLNHAIFKSLLFLGAGSAINQMHTRNMEEYGGLIKYMPLTAFSFLVGSMAISALPPFNGFFSEWLTFQSLFQGIITMGSSMRWLFVLAVGALAFTGGLALACFVKAFGAMFLARPRSPEVAHAKESPRTMLFGMGGLALSSLLFGVFSGPAVLAITTVGHNTIAGLKGTHSAEIVENGFNVTVNNGFASVSGLAFLALFAGILIVVVFVVRSLVNRRQVVKVGSTWDCGTALTPRMEITSTGFARSIVVILRGILKPSIQREIEYRDSEIRYLPKPKVVIPGVSNVYDIYLYQPINVWVEKLSLYAKKIQGGNINAYILYIFLILLVLLFTTS
jgi:hydrogenase-4 component B